MFYDYVFVEMDITLFVGFSVMSVVLVFYEVLVGL